MRPSGRENKMKTRQEREKEHGCHGPDTQPNKQQISKTYRKEYRIEKGKRTEIKVDGTIYIK